MTSHVKVAWLRGGAVALWSGCVLTRDMVK